MVLQMCGVLKDNKILSSYIIIKNFLNHKISLHNSFTHGKKSQNFITGKQKKGVKIKSQKKWKGNTHLNIQSQADLSQ